MPEANQPSLPLNVLFVEDDPADAELCLLELRRAGFAPAADLVQSEEDFLDRVRSCSYDVILSDHNLPGWTGMDALSIVREAGIDVPFILISGKLGEETAVDCIKQGAADCVLKDRLIRLPIAVRRALEEKKLREDRARSERQRLDAVAREQEARAQTRAETRFRELLEAAADPILELEEDGAVVLVNAAAERLFGYSRNELVGKPITALMPEASRAVYEALRLQCLGADAPGAETPRELSILTNTGHEIFVETNLSLLRSAEGARITCILRDLTERKVLEEQLRQSQKMEAIGRLAGGVAHDFNNLLTIIGGYSQMMLEGLDPKHPLRRDLEAVYEAANRASALTSQLLAFSRRQIVQPRIIDLNRLIGKMRKMLIRVIGEDVQLKVAHRRNLPRVKADPGQIEQVVMNLAVNARDAMPRGGSLSIETMEAEVEDAPGRALPGDARISPGRYVLLSMTDTGTGMDEEVRSHIFEPFFTTKGRGKGTGLGLSTVYGIVRQSGGYIEVESAPGEGATFRVYLPAYDAAERPLPADVELGELASGRETVLLVEDELPVRRLASEMLSRQGYRVLEAGTGSEALRVWGEEGDDVDVLVTDVVMPEMSGSELAEALRTARPGLKVLFISGYTSDVISRYGVGDDAAFVQKPFTQEVLGRKLRQLLDEE